MPATQRVSVAMATYNGAAYLQSQLASISAQTSRPAELVVSDDGSPDETLAIVDAFAANSPFPVRVQRNSDHVGATKNFERAIAACAGEYIALADQDDVWLPGKLASLERALDADASFGFAFSNARLIDAYGRDLGGKLLLDRRFPIGWIERAFAAGLEYELMLKRDFIYGTTLLFRASLRGLFLPIDERWSHDTWICQVLECFGYHGALVNEALTLYRQHGVQASQLVAPSDAAAKLDSYRALRAHVEARNTAARPASMESMRRLEEKIAHLDAVARMQRAPAPSRILPALREVASGRYRRYSPRLFSINRR